MFDVANAWAMRVVTVVCRRPQGLEDYPDLSLRLRGAVGRKLRELPPPRRWSVQLPPPYAVLFSPVARLPNRSELPKPLIIRASVTGDTVVAEARLVGWAAPYTDAAAAALIAALEDGISLSSSSRQRTPLIVDAASETVIDGLDVPQTSGSVSLRFRTPVVVRHRSRNLFDGRTVLRSTIGRSLSMVRWQGFDVPSEPDLEEQVDSMDIDDRELSATRWYRHSIRRGDDGIPMEGALGLLRVHGSLGPLLPYLSIASAINTGSHASLGLGWFDIAIYP